MARAHACGERGASLVPLFAALVGSRKAGMLGKRFPKDAGGLSRADLRKHIRTALRKAKELRNGNFSQQAVDLWVMTMQTLDVRHGKGERALGAAFFLEMAALFPETARGMLHLVPQYASWRTLNQLFMLLDGDAGGGAGQAAESCAILQSAIVQLYAQQLERDGATLTSGGEAAGGAAAAGAGGEDTAGRPSLAAKWAPSEKRFVDRASHLARHIALRLWPYTRQGVTMPPAHETWAMQQYRGLLTRLRAALNVPEVKMSGKRWRQLDPATVPGVATRKYRRALLNRALKGDYVRSSDKDRVKCAEKFQAAIDATRSEAASVRVKGAANQPHELVRNFMFGQDEDAMIEAQWVDLREKVAARGSLQASLCLVDVSGSMTGLPMEVSIALGILVSQLQPAPWTGRFLTFETTPRWHDISGCTSLREAVRSTKGAGWGGSTNFTAALQAILAHAKAHRVPPADMPTTLFVFSDMQFDCADRSCGPAGASSVFKHRGGATRSAYKKAGYDPPHIVFWNLAASKRQVYQAESGTSGVSMVSGFSPSMLQDVVQNGGCRNETPWTTLNRILTKPHYDRVRQVCATVRERPMTRYVFRGSFVDDYDTSAPQECVGAAAGAAAGSAPPA